MDPSSLRRGPIPAYPRNGTGTKLWNAVLRGHEGFPCTKQHDQHFQAQQKRREDAALSVFHFYSGGSDRPFPRLLQYGRGNERGVRTAP